MTATAKIEQIRQSIERHCDEIAKAGRAGDRDAVVAHNESIQNLLAHEAALQEQLDSESNL